MSDIQLSACVTVFSRIWRRGRRLGLLQTACGGAASGCHAPTFSLWRATCFRWAMLSSPACFQLSGSKQTAHLNGGVSERGKREERGQHVLGWSVCRLRGGRRSASSFWVRHAWALLWCRVTESASLTRTTRRGRHTEGLLEQVALLTPKARALSTWKCAARDVEVDLDGGNASWTMK